MVDDDVVVDDGVVLDSAAIAMLAARRGAAVWSIAWND